MKTIEQYSTHELQTELNKRKEKDNKIIATGTLKHDLYAFDRNDDLINIIDDYKYPEDFETLEEIQKRKEKLLKDIVVAINNTPKILKAGTKFEKNLYDWYLCENDPQKFDLESDIVSEKWAKKHLNIKKVV